MSNVRDVVGKIVQRAAGKISPLTFVSGEVSKMDREEVETLAVAYLMLRVKQSKRAAVAEVERRVVHHAPMPRFGTRAFEKWAEIPENEEAAREEFAWRERADARSAARLSDFMQSSLEAVNRHVASMKDQWTDELLGQMIALGDGTSVRWGEATVEQHQYRHDMHLKNATAGLEGAARHMAAIETLRETGCENLYAAVKVGVLA